MENLPRKTMKKTTSEQFELLCEEMKKHPELASNKPVFGGNKSKLEGLWADITLKLNGIGPPSRDMVEWKKVWSDLKGRTKKKISANHQSLIATGGGQFQCETLSPLEEMVDDAINIRAAAIPPGEVVGLSQRKNCESHEMANAPTTSTKPSSQKNYTQKRAADSTNDLLREQVNQQKQLVKFIGDFYETFKANTEAVQKQADATEKLANIAENFFNYMNSE